MTRDRIRFHRLYLIAMSLLMLPANHALADMVVDQKHGFRFTPPAGFVPDAQLASAGPDTIHGFVLDEPNNDGLRILLLIEKMRGTIGRERIDKKQLPPGFAGRIFLTNWQGFEVECFEVPERLEGINALTYNVQIPLKRAAIQLKLFGPADRKEELNRLLTEALSGLDGESNWMKSLSPIPSVAESKHYQTFLLICAIVFVGGGLAGLLIISRRSSKGTVLVISVGIYLLGVATDGTRVRELMLLGGCAKMLGVAGGILGLVDLIRKRKPRSAADAEADKG